MGIGPVDAIRKLVDCTGINLDTVDLVEVSGVQYDQTCFKLVLKIMFFLGK